MHRVTGQESGRVRILVQVFVTTWTVAARLLLSMEFSRQEYWSGLPFLSQRDLPEPGVKLMSLVFQVDSLPTEPPGKPLELNTTP